MVSARAFPSGQPIAYSHKQHIALGLQCLDCHSSADTGAAEMGAAEAGATAIIQPGGSMRDKEVIDAADEKGLAMVFTGMRHFRH